MHDVDELDFGLGGPAVLQHHLRQASDPIRRRGTVAFAWCPGRECLTPWVRLVKAVGAQVWRALAVGGLAVGAVSKGRRSLGWESLGRGACSLQDGDPGRRSATSAILTWQCASVERWSSARREPCWQRR